MLDVSELDALPLMHRVAIPDEYLDLMGHMNIRWYGTIFADAARKFTASFGITQEYVIGERKGAFMLRHFNHYLAEVRGGETVAVRPRLLGRSEKRLHYVNFMINESREMLAWRQRSVKQATFRCHRAVEPPVESAAGLRS